MITTGSRESLARARSAVAAAASAMASQVAAAACRGVGAPAPVVQRLHAGQADRHVELAVAPGAPEAVGDQHRRRVAPRAARAGARGCAARRRRGRGAARSASRAVMAEALEASTPALAQTKPWRVRQISTPRSARRISTDSSSTTWIARGSRSWPAGGARPPARRRARRGHVVERHERALGLGDGLVRDRHELTVVQRLAAQRGARISAARSSPGRTSGWR